jgi:heme-degrading monooxygenase HmoA
VVLRLSVRRYVVFVWVLEGKAADPGEVGRQLAHWTGEFGDTPGYLGATGGVTDDRRFLLLVRWESEEAGNELLLRREQQEWYEAFQESFDGAIEFAETGDVTTHLVGGSDAAGFVQAMKVSGVDRQRVETADREFENLAAQFRPDLIGGVRVWTAQDGFVEVNYFTSEQDARAGEKQAPPPEVAERFEDFMAMMKDAEYFDFTEPFLHTARRR